MIVKIVRHNEIMWMEKEDVTVEELKTHAEQQLKTALYSRYNEKTGHIELIEKI